MSRPGSGWPLEPSISGQGLGRAPVAGIKRGGARQHGASHLQDGADRSGQGWHACVEHTAGPATLKAAQRGCRLSESQPLVHIKQPTLAARILHPHQLLQQALTESVEGRRPSERSRERRSSVAMAAAARRALGLCGGGAGECGRKPGACAVVWLFRGTSQRGWRPQRGSTSGAQAAAYWRSLTGKTPLASAALLAPRNACIAAGHTAAMHKRADRHLGC